MKTRRAFSTTATLSFMFCFGMIGMGMVTLTTSHHFNAHRTADRQQAIALAESGMNVLYESVRADMNADGSYSNSIPSTDVFSEVGGKSVRLGSYSARVITVQASESDYGTDPNRRRAYTYTFRIEGTGRTKAGFQTKLVANFTATLERALVRTETGGPGADLLQQNEYWFPLAAVASNERINIETNGGFRTYAADEKSGHVMSNKGISLWSNKSSTTNPNVLDIQGQYLVPQGSAYDFTISTEGLANPNGSINYRNPGLAAFSGFAGSPANSVLRMPSAVGFPTDAEVDGWKSNWDAVVAKPTATKFTSGVTSTSISGRPGDGWKVITAPAVITGDLDIANGETLRFMPSSTNPKNNVIVVRGNVKNLGALLNLGVTIVMEGEYSDGPSSEYKLSQQGSLFASEDIVAQRSGFISTAKSKSAFKFSTNSSTRTGLIYAARGGISVTGANAEFKGALIAGGTGSNGGVKIAPGGANSFVVHYDSWAMSGGSVDLSSAPPVTVSYDVGAITRRFRPSALFNINRPVE